ncbi:hypothetical protein OESDEN_21302 [Oesophagostomum dentatum]|uniref:Uncharacterized protein n=1 Tax=Oesophagostomum dentatum TaxID=61180 RepID=A0A0B1S5A7_OESDE|nr:hypothetical protein OESDEN_21302 [Oesophagostomum dentatum]
MRKSAHPTKCSENVEQLVNALVRIPAQEDALWCVFVAVSANLDSTVTTTMFVFPTAVESVSE